MLHQACGISNHLIEKNGQTSKLGERKTDASSLFEIELRAE